MYRLLAEKPRNRDSDKRLMWRVWQLEGKAIGHSITWESFREARSTESIRRCRQKIQELNPKLQSDKKVQDAKQEKQETKGTFIYREIV